MSARVEFWTDWACAGGTRIGVAAGVHEIRRARSVDHVNDHITIRLPWDAAYLQDVGLRAVVRLTDRLGDVWEGRISSIDDGIEAGRAESVSIVCTPPILDLTTCGLLTAFDDADVGGATGYPSFQVGGIGLTPQQHIETFILPWLESRGFGWIGLGTIEFTDRIDVAGDRWTPMQYLQAIVARTGAELDFRRNGDSGYLIDLVEQRNSGMSPVLCRIDRNIQRLSRNRRAEPLKTVIVATGITPEGAVDPATIAYAAWEITAIASNTLTLADPANGPGPILYDDQYNGKYVLKPDATLVQITDTVAATQQIVVSSASGLAVGDHIEIRADSSGTQLVELENPAAVAEFGRVVGLAEHGEARGERNHVPNGLMTTWTVGRGDFYTPTLDGAHSATSTVNLAGLPPGLVIEANDWISTNISLLKTSPIPINTGGTVDGSGKVTITIAGAIIGGGGTTVFLYRQHTLPDGWDFSVASSSLFFNRTDPKLQDSLTGACVGVNSGARINIDGLTQGDRIQPGDILRVTTGGTEYFYQVVFPAVANSGGAATVTIATTLSVSTADNDPIAIIRPVFIDDISAGAVWLPIRTVQDAPIVSPGYTIWANENTPPLWAHCRFSLFHYQSATVGPAATFLSPKLEVVDASDDSVLATITSEAIEVEPFLMTEGILRVQFAITEPTPIKLRFYGLSGASLTTVAPWLFLHWAMVTIGEDPEVPAVIGSHANVLHRFASETLAKASEEPITLRAQIAHLAALNPDLVSEKLDVGQTVRVMATGLAGDTTLDREARITSAEFDEIDPRRSTLVLDTVPPRLTRTLSRARNERGEPIRTQPARTEGAPRATIPPGQQNEDPGTGAVNITRLKRAGAV